MLLIWTFVHLLNLYPCVPFLISVWLLRYCYQCPRIATRRNDRNREMSRKAIIVNCSTGIKLWVWVQCAGNENQTSVLTDLDLLALEPSVEISPTDEWHIGMSIAPVVLNKKLPTGSDGSQLRLNKKQGVEQEEERGWRGSDLCYRSIWSPLSFSLSLKCCHTGPISKHNHTRAKSAFG